MKKLDLFWKSNHSWWEFKNHIPTIKKDAPVQAQKSYERYLQQINEIKYQLNFREYKYGLLCIDFFAFMGLLDIFKKKV